MDIIWGQFNGWLRTIYWDAVLGIATVGYLVVTALLLYLTYRSLRQGKEAIRQAEKSLQQAEQSRMDALRPAIGVENLNSKGICYEVFPEWRQAEVSLSNVGVGPAFNVVATLSSLSEEYSITRPLWPAGYKERVRLGSRDERKYDPPSKLMARLYVDYADVYGRRFLSIYEVARETDERWYWRMVETSLLT